MNSPNIEAGIRQPAGQVEVDALKHEIHKLRWMGLEREAESACTRLSRISHAFGFSAEARDRD